MLLIAKKSNFFEMSPIPKTYRSFLWNIKKYFFLTSALLIWIAGSVQAQSLLTLKEAIRQGIENRKNVQSGKMDIKLRKLQTEALIRKYWPQVSFEYLNQYNPILATSILPIGIFNPSYPIDATKAVQFGTKWSQNAGLSLIQPLLDLTIGRQINEYQLQERISKGTEAQVEYQLAYDIAQAYNNIMIQESQIAISIADSNRTWISYQLQKNKFESHRLLKSDFNAALINHHNAVQKWKDALSLMIENKVFILYLIGQKNIQNVDFKLDTGLVVLPIQELILQFDSIPEIQSLSLEERLPSLQIKSERAKFLPNISLKGFLGANQYTNSFNPFQSGTWFGNSYLGLDIKIPFLNGDDKPRIIQQYHIQENQFKIQKEDKLEAYRKDAITARIRMERIMDQLKNQEENIKLSIENIQIFQDRVKEGQETASNLNTLESSLQDLEANLELAKKQYWAYQLDFLKASGKLFLLWN